MFKALATWAGCPTCIPGIKMSPILRLLLLTGCRLTEITLLQRQVLQTEKMASIGRLAAGVAHEINTPVQYIGDNITFLESAFKDLDAVVKAYMNEMLDIKLSTSSYSLKWMTEKAAEERENARRELEKRRILAIYPREESIIRARDERLKGMDNNIRVQEELLDDLRLDMKVLEAKKVPEDPKARASLESRIKSQQKVLINITGLLPGYAGSANKLPRSMSEY